MQKDSYARSVIYPHKHIYWFLLPVAFIVLLDEWIKSIGLTRLPEEGSLVDPGFIELAIHKNYGIVFDIPFKTELIILISVIIGIILIEIAYKNLKQHPDIAFSALMIILGALGNLYDRIVYGFTVDYLLIFQRSAINLSDIVIVVGVILLLLASRRPHHHHKIHPEEPRR